MRQEEREGGSERGEEEEKDERGKERGGRKIEKNISCSKYVYTKYIPFCVFIFFIVLLE